MRFNSSCPTGSVIVASHYILRTSYVFAQGHVKKVNKNETEPTTGYKSNGNSNEHPEYYKRTEGEAERREQIAMAGRPVRHSMVMQLAHAFGVEASGCRRRCRCCQSYNASPGSTDDTGGDAKGEQATTELVA